MQEEATFGHLPHMVDIQEVYCQAVQPIDVCASARAKKGLALIGMAANSYAHKPQLAKTAQASQTLLAEWMGVKPYPEGG